MKPKVKSYGTRNDRVMKSWIALVRSFNAIHSQESGYVQDHGITFGQFQVLEALYHRGELTVGELTKLIDSTPGNVTVVLKNLQKNSYLLSERSEVDGRVFINKISEKGKGLIENIFDQHVNNLAKSFEVLNDDELETLFTSLRKLYKHNR